LRAEESARDACRADMDTTRDGQMSIHDLTSRSKKIYQKNIQTDIKMFQKFTTLLSIPERSPDGILQ
jgi:hypothetical protein